MTSSSSKLEERGFGSAAPTSSLGLKACSGGDWLVQAPAVCDPRDPVPFEELWSGLVVHAAQTLRSLIEPELYPAVIEDPRGPLRSLLIDLSRIGAPAAFELFALYRAREANVEFVFGTAPCGGRRDAYDSFIGYLTRRDLAPLWDAFSALESLLVGRTELFIAATAELCRRWMADREAIAAAFPRLRGKTNPRNIRFGISESHCGGRTVARLSFAGDFALFYKPRSVDMEWGFVRFVDWFNRQGHGLPSLRAVSVLRRPDYGWMEEALPAPCNNLDAVARFYQRAGMLLALADLFQAVDFHSENLIASGEQPVAVDLETLFHPPGPFESAQVNSLERTELLPRPINAGSYVVCGLGAVPRGADIQFRRHGWRNINSDDMAPCELPASLPAGAVPRYRDAWPSVAPWVDNILSGFSSMHEFFRRRRDELWGDNGPIACAFGGGRSRFVLRATWIYAELLRRAVQPSPLTTQDSWRLSFAPLCHRDQRLDQLCGLEKKALERMDVPCFSTQTTDRFVSSEGRSIPGYFTSTGLDLARNAANVIDDGALNEKLVMIRCALQEATYPSWTAVPVSAAPSCGHA